MPLIDINTIGTIYYTNLKTEKLLLVRNAEGKHFPASSNHIKVKELSDIEASLLLMNKRRFIMNIQNRNLYNQIQITMEDQNVIKSVHTLTAALKHMENEDIVAIDERTYFLTIPVNHIHQLKEIKKVINTKIRNVFGFPTGANQLSLIICGDVKGTRTNVHDILGYQQPHFHALLLIPRSLYPKDDQMNNSVIQRTKQLLCKIQELKINGRPCEEIFIKPLDPNKGSLLFACSYIMKAETKAIFEGAEEFACSTFPYDKKA